MLVDNKNELISDTVPCKKKNSNFHFSFVKWPIFEGAEDTKSLSETPSISGSKLGELRCLQKASLFLLVKRSDDDLQLHSPWGAET